MARMTNSELTELVERLRAENASLRAETESLRGESALLRDEVAEVQAALITAAASRDAGTEIDTDDVLGLDAPDRAPRDRRRGRGRSVAAVALVVIGLVLAPVAAVASWAETQLVDTEAFVATFAPLAEDEAVKAFVVQEVMTAIDDQVDFEQTTSAVFAAVGELGLPPAADTALQALQRPAALGLRSLATGVVTDFVDSDAFETIWEQSLRLSHRQLVAAMTGDPSAALSISSSGELAVQLGPIVQAIRTAMIDQGLSFAEAIPDIDVAIVIGQSDALGRATLLYAVAVGVGTWLPWMVLALLVAGVAVARRRSVVLVRTALGLGLVMVLLGIALRVGGLIAVASIAPRYLPIDAATAVYDSVTSLLAASIVAVAVLAFTVMLVSWALSPLRPAPALRSVFGEAATRLRRFGDTRGIGTGAFGRFLARQRVLLQVLIGVAGAAIILLIRPLSGTQTIWTAVVVVLLLLLIELLQRPAGPPEHPEPTADAPTTDRMELRG